MTVKIYTDGSAWPRNPGNGGAAAILQYDGKIFYCSKYCGGHITNNQAELQAIKLALEVVVTTGLFDRDVELYSDSEYCLNCCSGQFRAIKNRWLVGENIKLVQRIPNLRMFWVKAHASNKWNNIVDQLCLLAAKNVAYSWKKEYTEEGFIADYTKLLEQEILKGSLNAN